MRYRKPKFQKKNVGRPLNSKLKCTGGRLSTQFNLNFNVISKNFNKRRPCVGRGVSKMKKVLLDKKHLSVKH